MTNAVSGAMEYRLATFILQAMAALVLFLILLSFYLPKKQQKDGDTALIFLLLYGVSQIVLTVPGMTSCFSGAMASSAWCRCLVRWGCCW